MKEKTAFLGTQSIKSLLLRMSAPAMVGMLVMSLYNVVDAIFIGRAIGELGLAGVTVSFPVQIAFFALALSVGIGASSEVSRSIGAGELERAEKTQGTAVFLVLVGSFLLMAVGLTFLNPVLIASGSDLEVLPFAADYTRVILYGAPFLISSVVGSNLARAEGNAKLAMMVMVAGALVNVVLDYIFLFPLQMGIEGAAWATSISNVVSLAILLPYFLNKKSAVPLHLKYIKWQTSIVKKIMMVGSASFMREVAFVLEMVVLNHVLITLGGSVAVAAIGIIMRLSMMALMPIFGIVQGMQPIAGYNFGAKKFDRVREVYCLAVGWGTVLSILAFVVLFFFPQFWAELFTTDEKSAELVRVTAEGLQWMVAGFMVVGFQSVSSGLYQSLGFGKQSLILSLFRQVLFLVPLVLILSSYYGLNGVWYSFPLAEAATTVAIIIMLYIDRKKLGLVK